MRGTRSGIPSEERVGQKFNMLTIVKLTGIEHSGKRTKVRCLVRCDCGNEKDVRIEGVVNGQQYSCGCNRKKNENSGFRKHFTNYRASAKHRRSGISFDLSELEFKEIVTQNCHYCGCEASIVRSAQGDSFTCNGIDRIDSELGYTIDNCVPCCSVCNRAKNDMDYNEFVAWTRRLAEWQLQHQKD